MTKDVKAILSALHEKEINFFFDKWIKELFHIHHFALLIVLPNKNVVHISSNRRLVEQYNNKQYGIFDEALRPERYEKLPYYPWRNNLLNNSTVNRIHAFREDIYKLNAGTNFVRKVDTEQGRFHIIYAVATRNSDPIMPILFYSNVNNILEIGDFAYNELRHIFQEHVDDYTLPIIEKFLPCSGGIISCLSETLRIDTSKSLREYKTKSNYRFKHRKKEKVYLICSNGKNLMRGAKNDT